MVENTVCIYIQELQSDGVWRYLISTGWGKAGSDCDYWCEIKENSEANGKV